MTRTCSDCEKPIATRAKGTRCLTCFNKARAAKPKNCSVCGIALNARQNKSGMCRTHALHAAVARKRVEDPSFVEKMRELGRATVYQNLLSPEARARSRPAMAEVGKLRTERMLGWCPVEYRDEYRRLMRGGHNSARQAKAQILKQIGADRLARLTTFDNLPAAVDYLRRYTAVFKRGDGYLYGTTLLTPEQLIKRALDKGWQPFEWRKAA